MSIVLNADESQRGRRRAGGAAHRRRGWRTLALALLACRVASSQPSDDSAWRDIESRIQYGYYTEDRRALSGLAEALSAAEPREKMHSYYLALIDWRLAQLAMRGSTAAGDAGAALAHRCVSEADTALGAQADFADALVLRAACSAPPLTGHGLLASLAYHRAQRDMERARQLAPHDPRVLLVDAMSESRAAPAPDHPDPTLGKLRQAVSAFEAERAAAPHLPSWGAADAYLLLARALLEHGDPIGARDALERALLIAPQFAQARRLMARVVSG